MPIVAIAERLLNERLGRTLSPEELTETLHSLGCEVEGIEELNRHQCARCSNIMETMAQEEPPARCSSCGADFREDPTLSQALAAARVVRLDMLPARPDLFDPGGLSRALRAYLGQAPGLADYKVAPAQYTVEVDPRLTEATSYRPHIVCAVIRNVRFNEDLLRAVMRLQETLHWALGRDRKRGSIGVYDLNTLDGTKFRYLADDPDDRRFVPLGGLPGEVEQNATMRTILRDHPKGKQFAHLIEQFERFPVLVDASDHPLSMPPIINSDPTRVTIDTTDLFMDVTGVTADTVTFMLNQMVTSIIELAPEAKVEAVQIVHPDGERITPDLAFRTRTFDPDMAARRIGVGLDAPATAKLLEKMGYGAEVNDAGTLDVRVPAYRNDILHDVDLVEDIAIAYGYTNIPPVLVESNTISRSRPDTQLAEVARQAMIGLGSMEVMTLLLTSRPKAFESLQLPEPHEAVEIANPIHPDQTILRPSLLPGLMESLSHNRDQRIPQRLFEVGKVTVFDEADESGTQDRYHLAGVELAVDVGFSHVRTTVAAVLAELGLTLEVAPLDHPTFIPGRAAAISTRRGDETLELGFMGEIHPAVLDSFSLVYPVAAYEIDLHRLLDGDGQHGPA